MGNKTFEWKWTPKLKFGLCKFVNIFENNLRTSFFKGIAKCIHMIPIKQGRHII